jgi:ABC-type methionine transport system ATPase subunit
MRPEEALALVGLGERLDHFPAQLSGGEQQRVAIARAMAKNPAVLLCDEPTGALDSATGVIVLEVMEKVNRELGTLTVLITHNAGIADMADRVIRLSDGRIVEETSQRQRRRRELPGEEGRRTSCRGEGGPAMNRRPPSTASSCATSGTCAARCWPSRR